MIACKDLAQEVKDKVKQTIQELGSAPTLAIVSVGNDPASMSYVKGKVRDCHEVGIVATHFDLPEDTTQAQLDSMMITASYADGVILQLPLPNHLNAEQALSYLDPRKDVDGICNGTKFIPCTARGVHEWLIRNVKLKGKHVVIINRSKLVGRPLVNLLLDSDATVTVCHSKTGWLRRHLKQADIVVTAVGKPRFVDYTMLKTDTVVVDVGINRVKGKLCGDYLPTPFDADYNITVTPVPGGVGLLTRAYLMQNVLEAHMEQAQ